MINKQRVRRIKNLIYAFIVLVFFMPAVLALALLFRVLSLEHTLNAALSQSSAVISAPATDPANAENSEDSATLSSESQRSHSTSTQDTPDSSSEQSSSSDTSDLSSMDSNTPGSASGQSQSQNQGSSGNATAYSEPPSQNDADINSPNTGVGSYPNLTFDNPANVLDSPNTGAQ